MNTWQKVIKLDSVNSTNEYVSNRLKQEKLVEGTIIYTLFQTAGKGQASNRWESNKNQNILLSLVLYPNFIKVTDQFVLSKAISLGIASYCEKYIDCITIKWPNDIYYRNKKLAGILIENSIKGNTIEKSIIGIGLNLNQESYSENIPNPVSIKQITNQNYVIEDEIIKLREEIKFYYNKLKTDNSYLDSAYINKMYRVNEFFDYKINTEKINAKIVGVNEFGYLQLELKTGERKEFDLKEIEFVI